ncbi:MAG: hypothetical protein ACI8ZM_001066 [Crocinitomix sp.]|jgi:hypothetical protein
MSVSAPPHIKIKRNTRMIAGGIKRTFTKDSTDWVNEETGECLTDYEPSFQLEFMLANRIDIDLN